MTGPRIPSTKVIKRSTTVENDDGTTREQVQYSITVPRKIADEYELEGVAFEWTVESGERLVLTRE